jgi:catechol 2,3-dioxygenase-like lactoylglutathione lyase family enzyme
MRLNHLDLYVPDVVETSVFLTRHFGLQYNSAPDNTRLVILSDDAGLELVVSTPVPAFGGTDHVKIKAETYHIGFLQDQKTDVDRLYESLLEAGAEVSAPPRAIRGGWLFYCTAPGRILIEVGWRLTTPASRPKEPR